MINMSLSKTESYRRDISHLVYWCNSSELINMGKLAALKIGGLINQKGATIKCKYILT